MHYRLIDSHSHFDDSRFDHDRGSVYERARNAGVLAQILPGIKAAWWPRLREVCQSYSGLYPAYGLHPMFCDEHRDQHLDQLESWLRREQPVALGECGLDFYIEPADRKRQQWLLEAQLDLARHLGLPVIIHARRAVEEVINLVRRFDGLTGVLHSFSGSEQQARRLVDLGFKLSFGGPLTYDRAKRLRRLVTSLPLEALLLETDSPDQPDREIQGQRNEPARLVGILETVSALRNETSERLAQATRENAEHLFKLPVT